AYIREYYAAEDKAALFKSFSLSPFVLSIVGVLLILLWNPSWSSEIIFDLNNAKLGILFLVFLLTTLFTRFFSLILR
ncbi:lipopolysaccharide biosynthesis protein, partial [Neisseria sp. P0003.S003]